MLGLKLNHVGKMGAQVFKVISKSKDKTENNTNPIQTKSTISPYFRGQLHEKFT